MEVFRGKHLALMLQVDGGEVVIVTAENFWNEISKVLPATNMLQPPCQHATV